MGEGTICTRMGSYAWRVSPANCRATSTADHDFSVNSIEGMKNALPGLRRKLNTDPVYFKKVYMHTFDLAKAAGARTLAFDTGKSLDSALSSFPRKYDKTDIQRSTYGTSTSLQHSNHDHQLYHVYQPPNLQILPQRQILLNSQKSTSTCGLHSRKRRARRLVKILGVCLWIS